jgi:hypothetical protein
LGKNLNGGENCSAGVHVILQFNNTDAMNSLNKIAGSV